MLTRCLFVLWIIGWATLASGAEEVKFTASGSTFIYPLIDATYLLHARLGCIPLRLKSV